MAPQARLTRWAFDNRRRLGLKTTEFGWARKLGMPFYDFEVKLETSEGTMSGRGTERSESLAFEKAVAEAVERAACARLGFGTVGVAVHPDADRARFHSRREFVERFLFNQHLRRGARLRELPGNLTVMAPALGTARFFKTVEAGSSSATVCVLSQGERKFLGLALATEDIRDTAAHAYIESARNAAAFFFNPDRFLADFAGNPDLWCCDTGLINDLQSRIATADEPQVKLPAIAQVCHDPSVIVGFGDCPAVIVRTMGEALNA